MRVVRLTIKSVFGSIATPENGYSKMVPEMIYFSTVQGILSRLYDKTIFFEEILPFSYTFNYSTSFIKHFDYVSNRFNADPSKDVGDTFFREFYIDPTVRIYLPLKFKEREFVNNVYLFTPDYPADVTKQTVDLVPIKEFDGKRIMVGGSIIDAPVNGACILFAPYEYRYPNEYERYVRSRGRFYYFPQGLILRKEVLLKRFHNTQNVYVDPTVSSNRFDGRLAVLLNDHPVKVFGGEFLEE